MVSEWSMGGTNFADIYQLAVFADNVYGNEGDAVSVQFKKVNLDFLKLKRLFMLVECRLV